MLKSLIATCLLTFGCSNGSIHRSYIDFSRCSIESEHNICLVADNVKPRNAVTGGISGVYNFKSVISFDTSLSFNETIVFDPNYQAVVPCCVYVSSDDVFEINYLYSMQIYTSSLSLSVALKLFHVGGTSVDRTLLVHFSNNDELVDSLNWCKYLYFNTSYSNSYPSTDFLNWFNILFTHEPNLYHKVLNGYYRFNSSMPSGDNILFMENVIYDNTLFSYAFENISQGTLYGYYVTYVNGSNLANSYSLPVDSTQGINPDFYFNNTWVTDLNYTYMYANGVFGYLPSSTNYDFKDLTFSVVDAPIHMLRSLFDFELFGITFGVAVFGILTLLVIVFVFKKIS